MKGVDLVYHGRHGVVLVPMPLGGEREVAWGQVFTASEAHAAALLEQPDNWKLASKNVKKESE